MVTALVPVQKQLTPTQKMLVKLCIETVGIESVTFVDDDLLDDNETFVRLEASPGYVFKNRRESPVHSFILYHDDDESTLAWLKVLPKKLDPICFYDE